jgi:hypothetical protein
LFCPDACTLHLADSSICTSSAYLHVQGQRARQSVMRQNHENPQPNKNKIATRYVRGHKELRARIHII